MSGSAILKNSGSVVISLGKRICIGLVSSKEGDSNNGEWQDEGGIPLAIWLVRLRMAQF
jgi:hypothetical protein